MRTLACIIIITITANNLLSQSGSVEDKLTNIEIGLGIFANYEKKLTNVSTIRYELGLDYYFYGGLLWNPTRHNLTPTIQIEHRWYFNINKKHLKGKNISNNNSWFISSYIKYFPDLFVISNVKNMWKPDVFNFMSLIGYKKNMNQHFYLEAAAGLGYSHVYSRTGIYFVDGFYYTSSIRQMAYLRIGYRIFKKEKTPELTMKF